MKNYPLVIIVLCCISFSYSKTLSAEQIEKIYTQAVDERFNRDLAKARYLLETLQGDGVTNEFIFSLLVEIYQEYLSELIHKKDMTVLQIAYSGIRNNLTKIWDLYPDSVPIQNAGLMITAMMNDSNLSLVMTTMILEKNPDHFFANYFSGARCLLAEDYDSAIPFFIKAAFRSLGSPQDRYLFESRMFLGDLYLRQKKHDRSLFYYKKAHEIAAPPDLLAKIAMLETYYRNFSEAELLFQEIPVEIMTPRLFETYIAALIGQGSDAAREKMTLMLSQNKKNPPFAQSIIQDILGHTDKALTFLENSTFIATELPWSFYTLKLKLLARLHKKKEMWVVREQIGQYFFTNKKFQLAQKYLKNIPDYLDTEGEIAYSLGIIAQELNQPKKAKKYYQKSLEKKEDLKYYVGLIELCIEDKEFEQAESYLRKAQKIEHYNERWWSLFMFSTIRSAEKKYDEAERYIQEILIQFPDNIAFNNFLALLYIEQSQYELAEEQLRKTYKLDENDHLTMNNLAYLYALMQKNYDESLDLSLRLVQEFPEEVMFLDTLAWVYYQNGDMDLAQCVFEEIEALMNNVVNKSKLVEIFAHLGLFYRTKGDIKQSDLYFQEGLQSDPDHIYLNKIMMQY